MLTRIQQIFIVQENNFSLFDSIQMFFSRKLFVDIAETLFTAIFSKKKLCKNGQKMKNVKTSKFFRQFEGYDDMSEFG